jgi:hypothetical protein
MSPESFALSVVSTTTRNLLPVIFFGACQCTRAAHGNLEDPNDIVEKWSCLYSFQLFSPVLGRALLTTGLR